MDGNGKSRPVWGAWIEMASASIPARLAISRAPYGARGLKSDLERREEERM